MGQAGRNGAFQRLVDDHYAALYRYAYRLSGTADAAGDLSQEAFCKAQAQFAQLRDPERAKSWLFSILRNAYLHRLRGQKNHHCVSLTDVKELPERSPGRPSFPIESERLQEALNELPEGFRTPVILYYFEDFSYRDIAL